MTNEQLILEEWGRIRRSQRRIEDLRMAIGKPKDNILMAEQEIIRLQDDEKGNADVSRAGNGTVQQSS